MAPDQYFLGYSSVEQRRLQQQAQELAAESAALFDQIGFPLGSRVVEIGCGPQGCLELLSDRVGARGSVVGVEVNEDASAMARHFVSERQLNNVEIRQGDAKATGLPRSTFDLATARLVLVNVPQPEEIVLEMAALVRSAGVVALHEADWGLIVCDPPLDAWDRLTQAFVAYAQANGIDPLVGRRIARLLRTTGLTNVQFTPLIHVYDVNHSRRTIFPQFAKNLRSRLLAEGIITEAAFDEALGSMERHLADANTLVVWTYFQAWATKP